MKHLSYSLKSSPADRHALDVMKDFGITYQIAVPQTISDCWQFWNCENVPEPLPRFLKVMDMQPEDAVGYGLSKADCAAIRARGKA